MRVSVLTLDRVFDLGLAAVLDAFRTANELSELTGAKVEPFDVKVVGFRRHVRTAQDLKLDVGPIDGRTPDCVVVPALGFKMPQALEAALARPDVREAGAALKGWARRKPLMTAACVGTFVMAESGLLNERDSTTTWWLAPMFRQRYPAVRLTDGAMLVTSGNFVTAGAALSHIDLALWLIRSVSPDLAALTARYLIVDARPSQSAYALADHLIHADEIVQRFERWARAHLAEGFSLDKAAHDVGCSKRTLARRTEHVLGQSPLAFFQRLRVEHAVHLLRTTEESVDEVAARVGYADGATLRSLLRKQLHAGVKQLRVGV